MTALIAASTGLLASLVLLRRSRESGRRGLTVAAGVLAAANAALLVAAVFVGSS